MKHRQGRFYSQTPKVIQFSYFGYKKSPSNVLILYELCDDDLLSIVTDVTVHKFSWSEDQIFFSQKDESEWVLWSK